MIRVMIVDDEPYIRQGLKILINWEQYGFSVCAEAANGKEALELMGQNEFDLVITDIKMPNMSGIELLEHTREAISNKISFIILSGFSDFEYAKKAIKYQVVDYILKPVQKEELLRVLESYKERHFRKLADNKKLEDSNKILFDRNLAYLLSGRYHQDNLEYVKKYLADSGRVRYINIEFDASEERFKILTQEERMTVRGLLYDTLGIFLGDHRYHACMEAKPGEDIYGIGFIFAKKLAEEAGLSEKEYIRKLYGKISENLPYRILIYIGQTVGEIGQISESYKSAAIARTFQLFSYVKDIAYYDEIDSKPDTGHATVDKELMDGLVHAVEENETESINQRIDTVYDHFKELATTPDIIRMNLNYLLFNLISLAKDADPNFDQGEVYKMISQGGYEQIVVRGSVKHFKEFILEFSDYLFQMRQHAFSGVLSKIEKEITENYKNNLSLKSLGEKYYINSAYLGQIFKRQYGYSFKDYLNNVRIDRAAELLIRSDEKVYLIADAVGFNNTDYFINKFVQIKGTTPLQYRKSYRKPDKVHCEKN